MELIIIFVILPLSFLTVSLISSASFMLKKGSYFREMNKRISVGGSYQTVYYHETYFNPKNFTMYAVVEIKFEESPYFDKGYVIVGKRFLSWVTSYSLRAYDFNEKLLGTDEEKVEYIKIKQALESKDYELVIKLATTK